MLIPLLVAVVGAAAGFAIGWVAGGRRMAARTPRISVSGFADELLASETATHVAAGYATDTSFEALAFALLERCEAQVNLPCALVMREREGAPAFIAAASASADQRLVGVEVPLDSPAGRAITEGLPSVGSDDERVIEIGRRDRRRAPRGGISVPIIQGPSVVGAVVAFGVPAEGTEAAVTGLAELIRRWGPVLVPAHAVSVANRKANTDELTSLPNRRALNSALSRAGAEQAALILLDIDHFKLINDTIGHPGGDAALKHLARILRDTLRGRDLAARVGGEEFAVWLPGTDLRTAQDVAERLRKRIADSPFRTEGEERILTISCGVAGYPQPIGSVQNLMGAADIALYRAKRGGRNRVVTSMDPADAAGPVGPDEGERELGVGD